MLCFNRFCYRQVAKFIACCLKKHLKKTVDKKMEGKNGSSETTNEVTTPTVQTQTTIQPVSFDSVC